MAHIGAPLSMPTRKEAGTSTSTSASASASAGGLSFSMQGGAKCAAVLTGSMQVRSLHISGLSSLSDNTPHSLGRGTVLCGCLSRILDFKFHPQSSRCTCRSRFRNRNLLVLRRVELRLSYIDIAYALSGSFDIRSRARALHTTDKAAADARR